MSKTLKILSAGAAVAFLVIVGIFSYCDQQSSQFQKNNIATSNLSTELSTSQTENSTNSTQTSTNSSSDLTATLQKVTDDESVEKEDFSAETSDSSQITKDSDDIAGLGQSFNENDF